MEPVAHLLIRDFFLVNSISPLHFLGLQVFGHPHRLEDLAFSFSKSVQIFIISGLFCASMVEAAPAGRSYGERSCRT